MYKNNSFNPKTVISFSKAQVNKLQSLNTALLAHDINGAYDKAQSLMKEIASGLRYVVDFSFLVVTYDNLGSMALKHKDFTTAELYLKRAQKYSQGMADDTRTKAIITKLLEIHALKQPASSTTLVPLRAAQTQNEICKQMESLASSASNHSKQAHYKEALPLFCDALQLAQSIYTQSHKEIGTAHHNVGAAYHEVYLANPTEKCFLEKAQVHLSQAYAIRVKNKDNDFAEKSLKRLTAVNTSLETVSNINRSTYSSIKK